MTDTFDAGLFPVEDEPLVEQPQPAAPPPELGLGADFASPTPMLPPQPAEVFAAMKEMRPVRTPDEVSAADRLLLGPQVLKPTDRHVPPPAPDAVTQASSILGKTPDIDDPAVLNVASRIEHYKQQGADPDADADLFQRLAENRNLIRGNDLVRRALSGEQMDDADWLEASVAIRATADVLGKLPPDLSVGDGKVVGIVPSIDGVDLVVGFPDGSIPLSTTGDPSRTLAVADLEIATEGVSAIVGNRGVTIAAPASETTVAQFRNLYPAVDGADGQPRWLPKQPVRLRGHEAIDAGLMSTPGAVVETYPDIDSYPGLRGGDWITFDVPPETFGPVSWRAPDWMTDIEEARGGVALSTPSRQMAPVESVASEQDASRLLASHAWAVLPPQGTPQATARMLSRIKASGLHPFELAGETKGWLTFGVVDPTEFSDRPAWSHDGLHGDGDVDPPIWQFRTGDGTVALVEPPATPAAPGVARRTTHARRAAYRVQPDQLERLEGMVRDLETTGALNVTVHTRQAELAGFERAVDSLFDDGVSLKVVRTAAPLAASTNDVPVFVRSTAGLPTTRPPLDARSVDMSSLRFEVNGRRVEVQAGDDLAEAAHAAHILARVFGYGNVRLMRPDGTEALIHRF